MLHVKPKALYHCVPLSLDMHFEAIEAVLREFELFIYLAITLFN